MRIMNWMLASLLFAAPAVAQQRARPSDATSELTAMLNRFMRDASNNNRAGFERFFASEVVYTGSNGVVSTKADIMGRLGTRTTASATGTEQSYSAENILVHDFGDTAIVAFQLVARTQHTDGKIETSNYRDTGTFLRRNGRWQVIAWQATRIPEKPPAK